MQIITTDLKCGPTKYGNGGVVQFMRYAHNLEYAMRVIDPETGEPQFMATVCLEDAPSAMEHGAVWLKGWSENEGVPDALEEAGIVKRTGDKWLTGYVAAEMALLSDEALAAAEKVEIPLQ